MDIKPHLASLKHRLQSADLLAYESVDRAVHDTEWVNCETQTIASDYAVRDGKVTLYPSAYSKLGTDNLMIKALAECIWKSFSQDKKTRWDRKYATPEPGQIDRFQEKLRRSYKSFRDIVESFKTASDRLVAINISNAFIVNGIAVEDAKNIDVREWPCTSDYASLERYHSLIPLVSAYCPELSKEFPNAFVGYVSNAFTDVYESSTRRAFTKLFLGMLS